MAKLSSAIQFIGTIGNLTVYKRKDSDELIVRKKGGVSKKRIKNDWQFTNTRRVNVEFGGCSTAAKWIRSAMGTIEYLTKDPVSGPLTTYLKPIQKLDQTSEWGKRDVVLSKNPQYMAGYNLNKTNGFDSMLRSPVEFSFQKDTLSADIVVPALIPGYNFFIHGYNPVYRIELVLGIVPDVFYDKERNKYYPKSNYVFNMVNKMDTDWFPVSKGSPAIPVSLKYPGTPPDSSFSLMLTIGIRFGTVGADNSIDMLKYQGAGKVLGAV